MFMEEEIFKAFNEQGRTGAHEEEKASVYGCCCLYRGEGSWMNTVIGNTISCIPWSHWLS
jgi:hypothetical protein